MKKFDIYYVDNNQNLCVKQRIEAGTGKSALKKFTAYLLFPSAYKMHRLNGIWTLSDSYGVRYVAMESSIKEYIVTDDKAEKDRIRYLYEIFDDELKKELKRRKDIPSSNIVGNRIWYEEVWTEDDIINNLPEGVEATPENIEKGVKAAAHIFDDKTLRNEMLVNTLKTVDYD